MRGREGSRWLTAELSEGGKAHKLNDWLTEEVCEWGRVELREGGRREGVWEWGTALREREGWSDWAEGGSILFLRREAWGRGRHEAWGRCEGGRSDKLHWSECWTELIEVKDYNCKVQKWGRGREGLRNADRTEAAEGLKSEEEIWI